MRLRVSAALRCCGVSMKSGLEGRNNDTWGVTDRLMLHVSMKSGLEGRNNLATGGSTLPSRLRLNEVRSRRPEQSIEDPVDWLLKLASQ